MPIHVTRPINIHQIRGDDLLLKTIQQSTCCSPSMVTTCLSCHNGCIGSLRYAAETSDLKSQCGGAPFRVWTTRKAIPRSCRLSSRIELSDLLIHELRECGLALWSLMSRRFVECGFETAETGGLYIPGR